MSVTIESVDENTDGDFAKYVEKLHQLSEGSVHKRFDPYVDIDWNSPELAVFANDERWILPESADPLTNGDWYRSLPKEKQIAIGMWRQANVAKVGLQFEQILINGMLNYIQTLPNGSPEFRYCTHEIIEEGNHTLMFQEMVNRVGMNVPGGSPYMKAFAPLFPIAGRLMPLVFFVGVLAGEEPIDHIQKSILRSGEEIHPIMANVMRIHVAEEARHISFAHEFLEHHIKELNTANRLALSIAFPIVMRVLCDFIAVPPPQFWETFDIPKSVKSELFWDHPKSQQTLRNYFADVRMLAEKAGLMNPVSKRIWKLMGIDGKQSRYRSEPNRAEALLLKSA
ncbi:diiron oxygenase [Antrihabitans sp. YC3-6]|uniref:Diiron oxygenase n=1 Tax=Antrihabitans stalagmiti TaxID=2799499 RepID=A0A934U2T1_9NOCA|nr:diiron oxygenase [Antrihabitans stalagmiti]MBJ8339404.1 diiron oxygenase [Antrihabitans stalagmiti]